MLARNAFGRGFTGESYKEFGGVPGVKYRLALAVIPMGDLNAVDVAQTCHEEILRRAGVGPELMKYGFPLPSGPLLEGLYIDDFVLVLDCSESEFHIPTGIDLDHILGYEDECARSNFEISKDKAVGLAAVNEEGKRVPVANVTAWGTEVQGIEGIVGVPREKRAKLVLLGFLLLSHMYVPKSLVRRMIGLAIHPFMHCKPLNSAFHRISKFLEGIGDQDLVSWSGDLDVWDELFTAALFLSIAHTDIR